MTHDDLLMLVTGGTNYTMAAEHLLYRKALRAVVKYHEPFDFTWGEETETACNCGEFYPCPTIQAIEKELL
jgi:hypothetical protein